MAQTFLNLNTGVTGNLNLATNVTGTLPTSNYVQGGITEADQWKVSSGFSSNADPIANNWRRVHENGFEKIGTGMSQSSGVFTFPSTGIWDIRYNLSAYKNGDDRTIMKLLYVTLNNSSYTNVGQADVSCSGVQSNNTHSSGANNYIFDVTDTANCKVKFSYSTNNSSTYYTNGSVVISLVTFIRMGDT